MRVGYTGIMTDSGESEPALWRIHAEALVDAVTARDDENGDIANHTADELRDALRVAAERLRAWQERDAAGQTLIGILRYSAIKHGDPVGGTDFSLYREYRAAHPQADLIELVQSGRTVPPADNALD